MNHTREERSLGDLVSDLTDETRRLIRQEIALAKMEMSDKIEKAIRDIGFLFIGGAVIYAGFLALLTAAIIGLGTALAPWLSALIVGAVVGVVGFALITKGISDLKHRDFVPRRTLSTLKEDKEWLKEQT